MIPTLHTKRLTLRPPHLNDVPAYTEILMSERAEHLGGPFSAEDAWLDFCAGVAGWQLRGYGTLSIEKRDESGFLGLIFLHREFGDPEDELGWILTDVAEGKGYALEASIAVRDFAYETLGLTTVVSYIYAANTRSVTLAEKMGATIDPDAPKPAEHNDCLIYRHPAPEAMQ